MAVKTIGKTKAELKKPRVSPTKVATEALGLARVASTDAIKSSITSQRAYARAATAVKVAWFAIVLAVVGVVAAFVYVADKIG